MSTVSLCFICTSLSHTHTQSSNRPFKIKKLTPDQNRILSLTTIPHFMRNKHWALSAHPVIQNHYPTRLFQNSESSLGMRGHSNGVRGLASPDRGDKRSGAAGNNNSSHHPSNKNNNNNGSNHNDNHYHHHGGGGGGGGGSGSSETAHDGKKGGSSGGDTIAAMWPPKFVIALTNKEKEEDFLAIKGSKLPQRPKKRAKFIQRTLNLVSPGAWLCDLTLERYEVREKKVSKKRPRGLKAMGNMDSDSE